jgi:hypothetical protein
MLESLGVATRRPADPKSVKSSKSTTTATKSTPRRASAASPDE